MSFGQNPGKPYVGQGFMGELTMPLPVGGAQPRVFFALGIWSHGRAISTRRTGKFWADVAHKEDLALGRRTGPKGLEKGGVEKSSLFRNACNLVAPSHPLSFLAFSV